MQLRVDPGDSRRLDRFLSDHHPDISRSRLQALIREGRVHVNEQPSRPSYIVQPGDRIDIDIPEPAPLEVLPEPIPLQVVFEDGDLLVLDKPAGLTVHPAPGSWSGTLVNALLHHCSDLSGINGVLRPGIVHRLDRGTTGLMVVAKNDRAHRGLAGQLEIRTLGRRYHAVIWGTLPEDEVEVDEPIGRHPRDRKLMAVVPRGRPAHTRFSTVERFAFLSLVEAQLATGRTHQIRVHLLHLGRPVFGDPTYGGRTRAGGINPELAGSARQLLTSIDRQALHAYHLHFSHPVSGKLMEFEIEPAADFAGLVAAARLTRRAANGAGRLRG